MNNIIYLKFYPALNGDCILISYDGEQEKIHIVVDSGFGETYRDYLKPDLIKIAKNGEGLDRVVITHIDSDHIMGALSFFQDNLLPYISVNQIWHNTYRHIQPGDSQAIFPPGGDEQQVIAQLIRRGYQLPAAIAEQEISAKQGTTLGALILKGNYRWNSDFKGGAVSTAHRQWIEIDGLSSLYLLSPGKTELDKLYAYWKDEIFQYGLDPSVQIPYLDDAFEMLLSWEKSVQEVEEEISHSSPDIAMLTNTRFTEDRGITNGASIAFVLHVGPKRLLFLGDAHPSVIEKALSRYYTEGKIIFDLVKVSHHGSNRNTSPGLLNIVDSPKYIFTTNGKHGHPDIETIARIVGRPVPFKRQLYFNYPTDQAAYFDRADWMKKYNYDINYLHHSDFTIAL